MSKYSQISKRIGWNGHCAIPPIESAAELLHEVSYKHCETSFEMVFKIHRFAPSPENALEADTMKIINEAFKTGKQRFEQV